MSKPQISYEQATMKALAYAKADQLFILLSTRQANMKVGVSTPYIGVIQNDQKILFIFTKLETAKNFVNVNGYEKLDGIYPIGILKKGDEYNSLLTVCNMALNMGIRLIDFDKTDEANAFGCEIKWLMQVNKMPVGSISLTITKEEMAGLMEGNNASVPSRMNPVPFAEFRNPYQLSETRSNELTKMIFEGETVGDFVEAFRNKLSLFENCYLMEYINRALIPRAKNDNNQNHINFFNRILELLAIVIKDKVMTSQNIFTLINKETNKLFVKDLSVYLLYTDRFKYMGQFDYFKIDDKSHFFKSLNELDINRIIVTNGPDFMALISATIFLDDSKTFM